MNGAKVVFSKSPSISLGSTCWGSRVNVRLPSPAGLCRSNPHTVTHRAFIRASWSQCINPQCWFIWMCWSHRPCFWRNVRSSWIGELFFSPLCLQVKKIVFNVLSIKKKVILIITKHVLFKECFLMSWISILFYFILLFMINFYGPMIYFIGFVECPGTVEWHYSQTSVFWSEFVWNTVPFSYVCLIHALTVFYLQVYCSSLWSDRSAAVNMYIIISYRAAPHVHHVLQHVTVLVPLVHFFSNGTS